MTGHYAEFTVMFMEPFLDNSVHAAWGITLLEKFFRSSASMLLGMHLIGNNTLLSCGIEPLLLFYQGSKYDMCHREKRLHITVPWPDVWHDSCTHVDFPPYSSLFISLEQQEPGFIYIFNCLVQSAVPYSTESTATVSAERRRTL